MMNAQKLPSAFIVQRGLKVKLEWIFRIIRPVFLFMFFTGSAYAFWVFVAKPTLHIHSRKVWAEHDQFVKDCWRLGGDSWETINSYTLGGNPTQFCYLRNKRILVRELHTEF